MSDYHICKHIPCIRAKARKFLLRFSKEKANRFMKDILGSMYTGFMRQAFTMYQQASIFMLRGM